MAFLVKGVGSGSRLDNGYVAGRPQWLLYHTCLMHSVVFPPTAVASVELKLPGICTKSGHAHLSDHTHTQPDVLRVPPAAVAALHAVLLLVMLPQCVVECSWGVNLINQFAKRMPQAHGQCAMQHPCR